jgi:hypothetical protein
MKNYRFFYHFNKHLGGMTVHFKKECIPVKDVKCIVPCETKWNPANRQPRLVMQGFAKEVVIKNKIAYIL